MEKFTNKNNPLKRIKRGQVNEPTIQGAFSQQPSFNNVIDKPEPSPRFNENKTTTKGLKADYTRHTLEIKKEHLKKIQALASYRHTTNGDILTQLLDFSFNSISTETEKALTIFNNVKQPLF